MSPQSRMLKNKNRLVLRSFDGSLKFISACYERLSERDGEIRKESNIGVNTIYSVCNVRILFLRRS